MEKSFSLIALLKNNKKQHKMKLPQFDSVACVQKRRENSLKNKKSNRLTSFCLNRNVSDCESPQPGPAPTEAQLRIEHRRQQLARWKAEKERKKQEELSKKKKPFVTGIARPPLNFVPPLSVPKPGTSGPVTRAQAKAKANTVQLKTNFTQFAPKNAKFAPDLKTGTKLPVLALPSTARNKKATTVTFEPILPKSVNTVKQTRSRTADLNRKAAAELATNRNKVQTEPKTAKSKVNAKSEPASHPQTSRMNINKVFESQSSSSGSDVAPSDIKTRIKTPGPTKSMKERKNMTPKVLHLESTTSEEKSSSEEESVKRSPVRQNVVRNSTVENLHSRKSLRNSLSSIHMPSTSKYSSDSCSNDDELISEEAITPKNKKIPKSESGSEEKLRSPKCQEDLPLTPEQIEVVKKLSPCVTLSRGKDNARREIKWKMGEGLLDEDAHETDSVEHFRAQLASETARMEAQCRAWDELMQRDRERMPDDVQELVLVAVGQARLLMAQKLQQFASLVERCAQPTPGATLVTPADLRGFWDMVFMQVENIEVKFKELEELRAHNWVKEKPIEVKRKAVPKAGAKKAAKPAANSRLRDMIAAARKAKKDQEAQSPPTAELVPPSEPQKTFEAGFFCIRSAVKSPAGSASATPRDKNDLLRAVLSSEANKSASRQSASFAMLRASILSKNTECEGVAPLPPTPHMTPMNCVATPGRSILKCNNVGSTTKSPKTKKVLFNEAEAAMDVEKPTDNKENTNKPKLVRQDAVAERDSTYRSPIMTRRRMSNQTPKAKNDDNAADDVEAEENTRLTSPRKKALRELDGNVPETAAVAPRRSGRKRRSEVERLLS